MSTLSDWKLTSGDGQESYPLPSTMVFVGRTECDINIENETVDKRHAVITFDHYQNKFKVKDLGSSSGTYINDRRIPDQTYITIDEGDSVKIGNDSKPLQVEKCVGSGGSAIFHMPQSRSHDGISTASSGSQSGDEMTSHLSLTRSNSRPRWEQRPSMAECNGCIREQDLHHTCGANSELITATHTHSHSADEIRGSPVSPLDLRTKRQSSPHGLQDDSYHRHHHFEVDTHMPQDPIINTHHTIKHNHHERILESHHNNSPSPKSRRTAELIMADANFSSSKRGTPLYGQPSWWGETDADEHNKRLLQDIQKQIEEEKQQKTIDEKERQLPPLNSKPPAHRASTTETGGDSAKGLSFTVDLEDSLEEKEVLTELPSAASGDKLSNFLPENLRKSFRQRRERLSQSMERTKEAESSSPSASRRSKSPSTRSPKSQSPLNTTSSSNKRPVHSTPSATPGADKPNLFLINKMFYSPADKVGGASGVKDTDEETEYSMYSEAKVMNRSSTMPEMVASPTLPTVSKSRTYEAGLEEDKVSESGTYTIDEDNKELEKARQDIDQLFGLTNDDSSPTDETAEPSVDMQEVNGSVLVEVGSCKTTDTYPPEEDKSLPNELQIEEGTHSSQELLNDSSPSPAYNDDIVVGKPPVSPTFRTRSPEGRQASPPTRKSAGRKLPEVPGLGSEETRHSMNVETGRSNTMPRRKKEVEHSKEKILQELGIGESPVIEKQRPQLVEELLNSRTYHRDNDPIVVNKTTFYDKIISSQAMLSPEQSKQPPQYSDTNKTRQLKHSAARTSVDSVNTEVLLQSTDEFMKAIHSFSSDSEASTKTNGKSSSKTATRQSNTLSKSTADRLNNNNNNAKGNNGSSLPTPRSTTAKKDTPSRRSVAESVTARLSGAKKNQVNDLKSRDSDSNEGSLESLNNAKNSSKTGSLSTARPNRTFELRRARTGSVDSDTSSVTTPRSNGARQTGRSARSIDTEVSLGAKIVQKSRENGTAERTTPIKRNDGGRYSMRVTSTTNKSTSSKPSPSTNSKPASKKLTPRHSTNSMIARAEREKEAEKEREKAAWDRRRSYDPRRAVQEAKAKKTESRGSTPSSTHEESPQSSRPRANSYSGDTASIVSNAPTSRYNVTSDTRHSADVFQPMESDSLKLKLDKEDDLEDSSHELEIAKLSHNLAKDLEMLSMVDSDNEQTDRQQQHTTSKNSTNHQISPETEELVDSMFACQQQKSAFSSYRSVASITPEMTSPALSPMRKKLSSSQNLENGSPSAVDHSYNNLVLTSIQQLSGKLHNYTSNTVSRLREKGVSISTSPSPTDELEQDMPASSELAAILRTLKRVEQNIKVMDKALFSSVPQSDFSTVSNNEHEHYLAEIKRIRNEIAGFRPIESTDNTSKPAGKVPPKVASKPGASKARNTTSTTSKTSTSAYKRAVYY